MLMAMRAVVDIGSNSVKVLVAKMQQSATGEECVEEIFMDAVTSSLARGLPQSGKLSTHSIEATLDALKGFHKKISRFPLEKVYILGTAALREASNAQELCIDIEKIFAQGNC